MKRTLPTILSFRRPHQRCLWIGCCRILLIWIVNTMRNSRTRSWYIGGLPEPRQFRAYLRCSRYSTARKTMREWLCTRAIIWIEISTRWCKPLYEVINKTSMFEGRSTSMTCIEAPNSIASTCAEFLHLYSRYYKPHAGYRDEILACFLLKSHWRSRKKFASSFSAHLDFCS